MNKSIDEFMKDDSGPIRYQEAMFVHEMRRPNGDRPVKSFRDLEVWKLGKALSVEAHCDVLAGKLYRLWETLLN